MEAVSVPIMLRDNCQSAVSFIFTDASIQLSVNSKYLSLPPYAQIRRLCPSLDSRMFLTHSPAGCGETQKRRKSTEKEVNIVD